MKVDWKRVSGWSSGQWQSAKRLLLACAIVGVARLFREQLPALAWPGVAAFVVWRMEDRIRSLIDRLESLKAGSLEVGLTPALVERTEELTRSLQRRAGATSSADADPEPLDPKP